VGGGGAMQRKACGCMIISALPKTYPDHPVARTYSQVPPNAAQPPVGGVPEATRASWLADAANHTTHGGQNARQAKTGATIQLAGVVAVTTSKREWLARSDAGK